LETGQVKSVLDQLAAAGTFWLTFSGGEIFLRPDLIELVEYARGLNFSVALKTSGTVGPDDAQIEALAEAGLDSLQISFYSVDPSLHDRVTGLPASWARLWRTTEKCRARGLRVAFMSTIFSFTSDQIYPINDFTLRENIFMKMDGSLGPRWDGKPHPLGLAVGQARSREIQRLMGDEKRNKQECESGQTMCYLTPQGDLWPCIGVPRNCGTVIGGDNFSQIWHDSQKLNAFRAMQAWLPEGETPCIYFERTKKGTIRDHFFEKEITRKACG
jgi:MoaA/NifB/PqqE/SkfB family radical SAM enzyme